MSNRELNSEQSMKQNVEISEIKPEIVSKKEELKPREIIEYASTAIEAIGGQDETELNQGNWRKVVEKSILDNVGELPELLADKLKTVDAPLLNARAQEILSQISQEQDPIKIAQLQIELIYQYIGIISRVQNGGDKGFTPSIAKEVNGMDCSLSAWSLKEKLENSGVKGVSFKFGYLPGHAVGVITLADKRQVYVDAQNGIVERVEMEEVFEPNDTKMAYPLFEITSRERMVAHLPNEEEATRTNKTGSDYTPQWIGVQEDGTFHTLGNMHMFANPQSPTFYSETGRKFREGIGMPELEPELYEAGRRAMERWQTDKASDNEMGRYFVEEMGDNLQEGMAYNDQWNSYYAKFGQFLEDIIKNEGITINDEESTFGNMERARHAKWKGDQRSLFEQQEIDKIKENI